MAGVDVGAARSAAADWVRREGRLYAGYRGAYVTGSTAGLAPDAALPLGSDLDIAANTAIVPSLNLRAR
jgi:hypothetical protein